MRREDEPLAVLIAQERGVMVDDSGDVPPTELPEDEALKDGTVVVDDNAVYHEERTLQ